MSADFSSERHRLICLRQISKPSLLQELLQSSSASEVSSLKIRTRLQQSCWKLSSLAVPGLSYREAGVGSAARLSLPKTSFMWMIVLMVRVCESYLPAADNVARMVVPTRLFGHSSRRGRHNSLRPTQWTSNDDSAILWRVSTVRKEKDSN